MMEYLKSMAYSAILVGAFVFLANKMSGSSNSGDDYSSGFAQVDRFPSEPRFAAPVAPQATSFTAGTRFDRTQARPAAVPYNRGFQ